jgi:hypothetical protein
MQTPWPTQKASQTDPKRLEPAATDVHESQAVDHVGAPLYSASTLELAQISNRTSTSSAPAVDTAGATRFSLPPPPL